MDAPRPRKPAPVRPPRRRIGLRRDAPGADPHARSFTVVRTADATPIGHVECRMSHPRDGWLTVTGIEIASSARGWGYGTEAVRALEEQSRRWGAVKWFAAPVPRDNGFGLFFWLRLGYRPAAPGEVDGEAFWMVREV